jgi:hypothetical protein
MPGGSERSGWWLGRRSARGRIGSVIRNGAQALAALRPLYFVIEYLLQVLLLIGYIIL